MACAQEIKSELERSLERYHSVGSLFFVIAVRVVARHMCTLHNAAHQMNNLTSVDVVNVFASTSFSRST